MPARAVPSRQRAAPQTYENRTSRRHEISGPEHLAVANRIRAVRPKSGTLAADKTPALTLEPRRKHQIDLCGTRDAVSCEYDTNQGLLSPTQASEAAACKNPFSRPLVSHFQPVGYDCKTVRICTNTTYLWTEGTGASSSTSRTCAGRSPLRWLGGAIEQFAPDIEDKIIKDDGKAANTGRTSRMTRQESRWKQELSCP